jgi:hypothetical protein
MSATPEWPRQVDESDEDETVILPPSPEINPAAANSVLEAIRARREEMAGERYHDVAVPGYRGMLVMRMRPLDGRTITALRERHARSRSPDRNLNLMLDFLVNGCLDFLARRNEDDELTSLAEYDGGEPVVFGPRLAELIGLQPGADTARACALALFSLAPAPEMAVEAAATDWLGWAMAMNEEVGEELLGESPTTRR